MPLYPPCYQLFMKNLLWQLLKDFDNLGKHQDWGIRYLEKSQFRYRLDNSVLVEKISRCASSFLRMCFPQAADPKGYRWNQSGL